MLRFFKKTFSKALAAPKKAIFWFAGWMQLPIYFISTRKFSFSIFFCKLNGGFFTFFFLISTPAFHIFSLFLGKVQWRLSLSHWALVPGDPLLLVTPVPSSSAQNHNTTDLAARLVRGVRKRKGLLVEELVVENAEKQRTLSRNK